jgi:hypothetical protein
MGFFGFLKKEKVDPPKNPGATLPPPPEDAMPKDDLGGVPPLPEAPALPEAQDPMAPPRDLMDTPNLMDTSIEAVDTMGTAMQAAVEPQPTAPPMDTPDMMSPEHLQEEAFSQMDPAPAPVLDEKGAQMEELESNYADEHPLPHEQTLEQTPEQTPNEVSEEVLEQTSREMPEETAAETNWETPLPDFTTEELAAAERMEQHEAEPDLELPTFEEMEDAENLVLPERKPEGMLFVPALQYRDALNSITKIRRATKKGDASLKKLSDTIVVNKDPFTQYAEGLNAIQENLILMDNTLVSQR